MRKISLLFVSLCVSLLSACGGGGGGSNNNTTTNTTTPASTGTNQISVSVAKGVSGVVNAPTVSVTVCAPGTSTCQTINNVLVDTGSSGLRLAADALSTSFISALGSVQQGSVNVAECMQFADSYAWGSVKKADVKLGGETASNIPVQIIGDASYPNVPSDCASTSTNGEDTASALGANGILGISAFANDCGEYCVTYTTNSLYYVCASSTSCSESKADLTNQVPNPIVSFASDNNGSILTLTDPGLTGAASSSGTLTFGVDTQSNNTMPGTLYTLDAITGNLTATFNNNTYSSFIDSGSSAYFFNDSNITQCQGVYAGFYCPSSNQALSAVIQGSNGNNGSITFNVGNAQQLVTNNPTYYAFNNIGVVSSTTSSISQDMDFGLPFFYARNIATIIDGKTVSKGTGPAVAF